jgi:hypothetical protein
MTLMRGQRCSMACGCDALSRFLALLVQLPDWSCSLQCALVSFMRMVTGTLTSVWGHRRSDAWQTCHARAKGTPRAGLNSRAGGCNTPSLGCAAACHAETAKPHARRPSRRSWHRMRPIRRDVQEPARNLTRATHDRLVASAMQAQSRCAQQQPPNGARKAPHKGQATRAARAGGKLDPEHCTARMIPTSAESHLGGGVG